MFKPVDAAIFILDQIGPPGMDSGLHPHKTAQLKAGCPHPAEMDTVKTRLAAVDEAKSHNDRRFLGNTVTLDTAHCGAPKGSKAGNGRANNISAPGVLWDARLAGGSYG